MILMSPKNTKIRRFDSYMSITTTKLKKMTKLSLKLVRLTRVPKTVLCVLKAYPTMNRGVAMLKTV